MRLTRNQLKRIIRRGTDWRKYGPEGPMCIVCAGRIGGRKRRETLRAKEHAKEMRDGRDG